MSGCALIMDVHDTISCGHVTWGDVLNVVCSYLDDTYFPIKYVHRDMHHLFHMQKVDAIDRGDASA